MIRMAKREIHTGFWKGKLKRRWYLEDLVGKVEENIKIDLKEMGWGEMAWAD